MQPYVARVSGRVLESSWPAGVSRRWVHSGGVDPEGGTDASGTVRRVSLEPSITRFRDVMAAHRAELADASAHHPVCRYAGSPEGMAAPSSSSPLTMLSERSLHRESVDHITTNRFMTATPSARTRPDFETFANSPTRPAGPVSGCALRNREEGVCATSQSQVRRMAIVRPSAGDLLVYCQRISLHVV